MRIVFMDGSTEEWPSIMPTPNGWVMCFTSLTSPAAKWIPNHRIKELIPLAGA